MAPYQALLELTESRPRYMQWADLPLDLKRRVWSHVRLDDMLDVVQEAMPSADLRRDLDLRIAALRPLREAWVSCRFDAVRNLPQFRTRAARAAVLPAEFVTLERLVIGHSELRGTLSAAVAELRWTLKVLHCDSNELDDFPLELALCTKLINLDAFENAFKQVPAVICSMPSLRLLSFSHNPQLGPKLPNDIAKRLPALTHLGFYGCALTELPDSLIFEIANREVHGIFANVSYNNFPLKYLEGLYAKYPLFRSRVGVL
jgi:hypothetical protein